MEKVDAPCSSCIRVTKHEMLKAVVREDRDGLWLDKYQFISCLGCDTVSMSYARDWLDGEPAVQRHYPSPVSRAEPDWVFEQLYLAGSADEKQLGELLKEIYQAVHGEQHRLAAMGIRALLEQVMVSRIGDQRTFEMKLDEFQRRGYISLLQRDALVATIEVGHAAIHRGFKPTALELNTALDIVEGVMASIYTHSGAAEGLTKRVPKRQKK